MENLCVNWDKESWLSSKSYFDKLSSHLIRILNINTKSKILDIGCGRNHLLKNLSSKILFENELTGVEPVNHTYEKNSKIKIFNLDIQNFIKQNKKKYDVVIIKQVLHLISSKERIELYKSLIKILDTSGKLIIIQMDKNFNFPTFPMMSQILENSLNEHDKISRELNLFFKKLRYEKFSFLVNILKKDYIKMIENKFISILSNLSDFQIKKGCSHIDNKYPTNLIFEDKLNIIIVE